jgi:hypothetical protein
VHICDAAVGESLELDRRIVGIAGDGFLDFRLGHVKALTFGSEMILGSGATTT